MNSTKHRRAQTKRSSANLAPANNTLKAGEPAIVGMRRLLLAHVEAAATSLQAQRRLSDDAVHDVRKCLKRARAALRLLRSSLGETNYRRENRALRDIARPLTHVRDTKVLGETLDDLATRLRKRGDRVAVDDLRSALENDRVAVRQKLSPAVIASIVKALKEIKQQIETLSLNDAPELLSTDLKHVYKQGRKALAQAKKNPSDERLHELRKQVKYFGYQLRSLRPLRPTFVTPLAKQAARLGDVLGEDHDLAVLREKVVERPASSRSAGVTVLTDFLMRRRRKLQDKALKKAQRLYAHAPRRLASCLESRM